MNPQSTWALENTQWTNSQDNQLQLLVEMHSAHNWEQVARMLKLSPAQCESRYLNHIVPARNYLPWSRSDEL